jgi:hypothetical protein
VPSSHVKSAGARLAMTCQARYHGGLGPLRPQGGQVSPAGHMQAGPVGRGAVQPPSRIM